MAGSVAAVDEALTGACGARPSWICEATWNLSHNRSLSRLADWLVTRPIAALVVLLVAWLVNRSLRRAVSAVINRLTTGDAGDDRQRSRAATLAAVSRASVSSFVWSISVLVVLGLFHIDLAPLLAGAGVAGLAVGLGAQSLVRDAIAGFFILLEDQCGVGDEVDLGHAVGVVESLTLRSTTLRSADGTLWTIPNGAIARIGNRTRSWSSGSVEIALAKTADLDAAMRVIGAAAAEAAGADGVADLVTSPPQVLGVERADQFGVVVRVEVRTVAGQLATVQRALRQNILRALRDADIPLFG